MDFLKRFFINLLLLLLVLAVLYFVFPGMMQNVYKLGIGVFGGGLLLLVLIIAALPRRSGRRRAKKQGKKDYPSYFQDDRPTNQRGKEVYPYRVRDDFLSPAETSFYHVLKSMVGENLTICPQAPLAALFFVAQGKQTQTYQNKIDRKRVDFVLCDPKTLKPRLAIELDDSSHQRPERQERDAFVEQVFVHAGLPLVRVPAQSSYNTQDLAAQFKRALQKDGAAQGDSSAQVTPAGEAPTCPKCGVPMVRRVARQGNTPGKAFWGCPNYPRCREMVFEPAAPAV